MVVFTAVIATTGVIGSLIFNNQLAVMKGQLDEMKSTGLDTKRAADAAKDAAEAAKQSADAVASIERPYIFVTAKPTKLAQKDGPNDTAPTISYSFTNLGRVPAIARLLYVRCFLAESLGTPKFSRSKFRTAQSAIGAGTTLDMPMCEFEQPFTEEDWADLKKSKKFAFLTALVLYEGALDYSYATAIAYQIDLFDGTAYAVGGVNYNYDQSERGRVTRGAGVALPNIVP